MDYKVGLSAEARNDLRAAVRFIAMEGKSPDAALRLGNELLDAALSLALFPRRGAPVRRRPGMRKLSHRHWLVFYQVNEVTHWVEIVRIWDGRKDPEALRFT
ncbi:MAG: type II toxin-antitoxin system RelE/ParE family toxin [Opitutae bacterium]|nr:type II toxin-antitoxin system RelE/ParE family toxin [Opitutae bacterium]